MTGLERGQVRGGSARLRCRKAPRAWPAVRCGPCVESGSVTVEAAVALSAVLVVLAVCLAGLACLTAALRVTDAAGQAARLAARGDHAAARQVVQRLAPAGSALSLSGDDLITAVVAAPPLGGLLPGVRVGATAVAAREPGEAGP